MLQTAKPIGKGRVYTTISGAGFINDDIILGNAEVGVRIGINEKSDFGASISMPSFYNIKTDYKRVLLSNRKKTLFLSTGLQLEGYVPEESTGFQIGFTIPLYFSFNHDGNFIPYIGQKFTNSIFGLNVHKYYWQEDPINKKVYESNNYFYAGGIGFRFGKKPGKWFLEFSYFMAYDRFFRSSYSEDNEAWQVNKGQRYDNRGFHFNFGKTIAAGGSKKDNSDSKKL